jgi:hypothetical protein
MSLPGDADLPARTRAALLDALEALEEQLDAIVVIGAQALYMHAGEADVAIPAATKDADIGIDGGRLRDDPKLEEALQRAGFHKDLEHPQPGGWINADGIPIDVMIPAAMAGPGAKGRRGVRIPPHANSAMRQARGLEAAIVDNAPKEIPSLQAGDSRSYTVRVAGPGALLVAKLHKIGERDKDGGGRLVDKDAHDLYRLLVAIETAELAEVLDRLRKDAFAGQATEQALGYLKDLFASGPEATGSVMAGQAEEGVGEPAVVAASVAALADDLLKAVGERS